jgi:hypothetical protein
VFVAARQSEPTRLREKMGVLRLSRCYGIGPFASQASALTTVDDLRADRLGHVFAARRPRAVRVQQNLAQSQARSASRRLFPVNRGHLSGEGRGAAGRRQIVTAMNRRGFPPTYETSGCSLLRAPWSPSSPKQSFARAVCRQRQGGLRVRSTIVAPGVRQHRVGERSSLPGR